MKEPYLFSLKGKTVLITGATGYLGSEIADELAMAGAHILINSRSKSKAEALAEKFLAAGLSAEAAAFDITNERDIKNFFSGYKLGKLNVIVNNAHGGTLGSIETSKSEAYRSAFETAVVAAQNVFLGALPFLRAAVKADGGASIINISTMYALVSPNISIYSEPKVANPPFYGAAKAALLQWSKYGACEFGGENIRFNSITPGPFPTTTVQENSPDFIKVLASKVPLGRIGQAAEMRGPVLFLASNASTYVNGSNIQVDGGWTAW